MHPSNLILVHLENMDSTLQNETEVVTTNEMNMLYTCTFPSYCFQSNDHKMLKWTSCTHA